MQQFFRDLEAAQDKVERATLRFQFDLATKIADQTQKNIKRIFGQKEGAPRSEITLRAQGRTGRSSGRGGGLLGSVALERTTDGGVQVSVGGPGVPYAAIHEMGGVVTPKASLFLTIPFQPKYQGTRASEHELYFSVDEKWGPVLLVESWGKRKGAPTEKNIAFLLRKRARIPARPYLAPAVAKVTQEPEVRAMMRRLLKTDKIEVNVE